MQRNANLLKCLPQNLLPECIESSTACSVPFFWMDYTTDLNSYSMNGLTPDFRTVLAKQTIINLIMHLHVLQVKKYISPHICTTVPNSFVRVCVCVFMSVSLHAYVYLCGRACTFSCLPCPCAVVCSLYRKPRTVCPRLGVDNLFVKILIMSSLQ